MNNEITAWPISKILKLFTLVSLVISLVSCSSSGPATSYYSLFSVKNFQKVEAAKVGSSFGVSLISLPGYLETSAIVSRSAGQKLNVSGYHAWGEALDQAATRVLADNLNQLLNVDSGVQAFPWDMRVRPNLQLQVKVSEFDGVRGDYARLVCSWSIFNVEEKRTVAMGSFSKQVDTKDNSYDAYVGALNSLLNLFSIEVAKSLGSF